MSVVYFIRYWYASELVAHIKQWFGKRQPEATALTRCTTNKYGDYTPPAENPIHTRQCVAIPMRVGSIAGTDSLLLRFTQPSNGCLLALALALLLG